MALNLYRVTQAPHDMLQTLSSCEPLIFHVACRADAINLIIMQLETYANGLCKSFMTHHEMYRHSSGIQSMFDKNINRLEDDE